MRLDDVLADIARRRAMRLAEDSGATFRATREGGEVLIGAAQEFSGQAPLRAAVQRLKQERL